MVNLSMNNTININQSVKFYIALQAPLQDTYSEALPIQAKRKRTVLRRWWNWEQAPFGRCLRSTGSPFQVVGPTTEKERVCIVAERANGTTKLPWAEDRSVRRPAHEERRHVNFHSAVIYVFRYTNIQISASPRKAIRKCWNYLNL